MSNTSAQSQSLSSKVHRLFRCTRCSMSFSHQRAYHEHLHTHVPIAQGNAHNQTSGSSTAEDNARYIAERRKNYPTTDNISKKIKSDEERQEFGDILETRQFGRIKERKTIPNKNFEAVSTASVVKTTVTNAMHPNATLLERLLAPDIRRERNMVLQCIRHIVNNDFFGLDSN